MNIYLIERTDEINYDEYDSWVVVAPSAKAAMSMGPKKYPYKNCTYVGKAGSKYTKPKVIIASYNAG